MVEKHVSVTIVKIYMIGMTTKEKIFCKECNKKVPKKHNPCGNYCLIATSEDVVSALLAHGG